MLDIQDKKKKQNKTKGQVTMFETPALMRSHSGHTVTLCQFPTSAYFP